MIFTNVVKPTHLCNLSCKYCYNDDVRDPIMTPRTLERVVKETFSYVRREAPQRLASFIWHGGEPTLAGIEYFETAVKLQRQYGEGIAYNNSLQTNGILIKGDWLTFLKREGFTVSISIDGPSDIHDKFRVDRGGAGSFSRVIEAVHRVQDADIPLGVCVVLSKANIDHVDEIYDFLAEKKLRFNVIPLNKSGAARDNFDDVGLDAEEYAPAWIRLYDRWFEANSNYVYCSDFVFKTRAILAGRPADCIGLSQCSDTNIAIDPVGDVYPCATLSGTPANRYGNIVDNDLWTLMHGATADRYRNRDVDSQCASCRWQHVCHGGCQARAYKFFGDHSRRDYYCPSLFRIYEHIAFRLRSQLGVPRLSNDVTPPEPLTPSFSTSLVQLRRPT